MKDISKKIEEDVTEMIRELTESLRNMEILTARRKTPQNGIIYAEMNAKELGLGISEVMLSVNPVPEIIPDSELSRYLMLSVYKLPCPVKSTRILMVGTVDEIIEQLQNASGMDSINPSLTERIIMAIPELADNLADV